MRIIKHGSSQPVRFACRVCGCEFEAMLAEVVRITDSHGTHMECRCPECGSPSMAAQE